MAVETFYHGTSTGIASRILADGFDVHARRVSDPGDLGWGAYLTSSESRARSYGNAVLHVQIDTTNFARLKNPYFLDGLKSVKPKTATERLFYDVAFDDKGDMLTVQGRNRTAASKKVARTFMDHGYDGIIGGPFNMGDIEVVVFDDDAIVGVKQRAKPNIGTAWVNRMFDRYWDQMVARVGTGLMPTESDSANWKFEELGCGHYGCVLATESPGTVIKLTTDMSEAAFVSAALTLPEWPTGIVHYDDIFELPETYKNRRVFVLWRQEADNIGDLCGGMVSTAYEDRYVKRYSVYSLAEFHRNLSQWQFTAGYMRDQMRRAKQPKEFLERVQAEHDQAWSIYSDDRGFGHHRYAGRQMRKVHAWHRGPLAFALRHILLEQLAMTMANTHAGSLIGEAFGYYMDEGMLLADVHCNNIGEVVPEGYDSWDLVITDPGHMVPLDPKWLNVAIQML